MIKMFATIPRKPGLTAQQFHDHWRHPHGTLTRKISTITAYVQSHKLDSPHLPASQCPYDGAAEVWYDNLADALNMKDEPAYLRYNVPDEPRFVDMAGLKFILTEEEVVDAKIDILTAADEGDIAWSSRTAPVAVKLLQFIASDGHAAWASGEDIELARQLGAFRHVRCRPVDSVYGENPPFLGIRELFWPTQTAFETCVARASEAFKRIIAMAGHAAVFLAQAERVI